MFYFKDSSSDYWLLGITTFGQLTWTLVGAQQVGTYVLQDSEGNYWQLGVTTEPQLTLTSVGATTVTPIVLVDSNGISWQLGIDALGEPTQTRLMFLVSVSTDDVWLGGDEY